MKILVTGGAGFIGSHVVDAFIAAGHNVVVVDNLLTGRRSNLNPAAKLYQLDIRSAELEEVFAAERPEVVDHHAAQIDVRKSVADPLYDADVNLKGGLNVLSLAVKYGARKFIYISSGGAIYGDPLYLPCDEKHPIQPLSPYGATKYFLELYLPIYRQIHGLDYTILRYPNVYGPRQDPTGEGGVIAIFTGALMQNRPVTIYGDGEQTRDYLFVGDCARANLLALTGGSGGVYNLAWGRETSVNQLYRAISAITGCEIEPSYLPARPGEIFRTTLDASLAGKELGWEPLVPLEEGLRRTVAALIPRPLPPKQGEGES
jgi:UDP-glucose 4-epimerase